MGLPVKPVTSPLIKGFLLGYSGMAKSSSIFPLAIDGPIKGCPVPGPGFELKFLDYDSKAIEMAYAIIDALLAESRISAEQHEAALSRIDIVECSDKMGTVLVNEGGKMVSKFGVKGSAQGWQRGAKALEKWYKDLNDKTIVICDSITYAAKMVANLTQELNSKSNQMLTWRDYMAPQEMILDYLVVLSELPCHVLITGHQAPVDLTKKTGRVDDQGNEIEEIMDTIVVPVSIGRSPSIKLPARFNHLLLFATDGQGKNLTRYMYTIPHNGVTTKTPFFRTAKDRYESNFALLQYFDLRKK